MQTKHHAAGMLFHSQRCSKAAAVVSHCHRAHYKKNTLTSFTKSRSSHNHRQMCTKNFLKFGHMVPEISMHADRQTDRHASHNTQLLYWWQSNKNTEYVIYTYTVSIKKRCHPTTNYNWAHSMGP